MKDRAAILYDKFIKKTGLERHTGETEQDFEKRVLAESGLARDKVSTVTVSYLNARYGVEGHDALTRLESAIAAVSK